MKALRSFISCATAAVMLVASLPELGVLRDSHAEGVTYTSGEWQYELRSDVEGHEGETCAVVTKWTTEDENVWSVTVPDEIDGYPVAGIEGTPFDDSGSAHLMSLTLPDTVTYLADGFLGRSIYIFTMPDGITYVNYRYNDSDLNYHFSDELFVEEYEGDETDLVIPESIGGYPVVGLDSGCFYTFNNYDQFSPEEPGLTTVIDTPVVTTTALATEQPDDDGYDDTDVQTVGNTNPIAALKSVTLPESIVYIGAQAFENSNIESVNIPSGVLLINGNAFRNCKNLKSIDFPDTPIYAETTAFAETDIELPDNVVYNGGSTQKYLSFGDWGVKPVFRITEKPSHYVLNAMRYYGTDTEIYIPTELNGYRITKAELNVAEENEEYYSDKRVSVYVPESVSSNLHCAYNQFIKSVTYMGDSRAINEWGFSDSCIEEVNLPSNVTISRYAFEDCKNLTTVNFSGGGDIQIGIDAFSGCSALTEVNLPEDANSITIAAEAFAGTSLKELTVPACVTSIGDKVLNGCTTIEKLTFEGPIKLNYSTFTDLTSLKEITLAEGMTFGIACFRRLTSLENLNYPEGTVIYGEAFEGCTSLMKLNGKDVLDENCDILPDMLDAFKDSFGGSDDIGFINAYVTHMVEKTAAEVVDGGMSDMEKVKALHDWVCRAATYDGDNVSARKNHTDSSIFLNDSTVCDGYARALNLLYHEAGIESCYVKTTNHAWVIVKLGEHYFHVDPTWDRSGDNIEYYWFLQNDDKIASEPTCHGNNYISVPSSLHSFQWAELPECPDLMGDVDDNGVLDGRDASAILTSYALVSSGKESDIDTVLADLDYNGIIDGRDASIALTKYAEASVLNE